MATRRGWDGPAHRRAYELALDGWTAAEIDRELQRLVDAGTLPRDSVRGLRSIERLVGEVRPKDPSGRWRLSVAEGEDAPFLLATRVAVMEETGGRTRDISIGAVAWLRVIHVVAPDLEPPTAYRLARLYLSRMEREQDTGDLDAWLAFGPWRSPAAAAAYERAVDAEWISASPAALNWASRVVLAANVPVSPGVDPHVSGDLAWTGVVAESLASDAEGMEIEADS
jgi:hypothetical protein